MNNKILIIGATGFVGENLLRHIEFSKGCSLRDKDWKSQIDGFEILVNLVGKAHDHRGEASEQDYFFVNLELVKEIFHAFVCSNASILLHVSSIAALEEYSSNRPLTEEDICHPESWYGKSKREAEKWLLAQELPSNKKLIIIRPPMIHGPGDKGNLGLLYGLISRGLPYPLGSFDNYRSFISIENFCFFIIQMIEKRDRLHSGIFHVADNEFVSTNQIIEIIKQVTGKRVPNLSLPKFLVLGIARIGDFIPIILNSKRLKKMTSNLLVSNEKSKSSLNVTRLPLTAEEGLIKTIESFQ